MRYGKALLGSPVKNDLRGVGRLQPLNAAIVARIVEREPLRTLTIDVDGSVVSPGLQVDRAFRGFNPHHRKVHSYYIENADSRVSRA